MRKSVLLISAALVLAGTAHAQTSSPTPYGSSTTMQQHMRVTANRQVASTQTRLDQERLDRRAADANPRRADRAERVAALANAGNCQGAYDLAMAEGDRPMARRVAGMCATAPVTHQTDAQQ